MLAYVDDPDLTIDFTILAAEQRAVRAADFARLAKVDATRLATPAGTYARGLVELRRGNADQADLLLADAPPRSSGFHLYARALANLMRRTPEARSRSAELFTSLAEHYAKSSLARNAGNFARQLAPN